MNEKKIEISKDDLIKFLKSEYIKKGWLNGISNTITNDVIECIKNCTSPTGEGDEKLKAIFRAFSLFPMNDTKVLIIGQDPYPSDKYPNMADGLAFSQEHIERVYAVESLLNIFKAIRAYQYKEKDTIKYFCDIEQEEVPWATNLKEWANSNKILLLNTALTYKKNESHFKIWEHFTERIIENLLKENNNEKLTIFLWGVEAQKIFLKSLNQVEIEYKAHIEKEKNLLKPKEIEQITYKKNQSKLKINNELIRAEISVNIGNSKEIKLFMTSHPSNNYKSVEKGFSEDAPKHFKACDEFLGKIEGKYIWKDFPENNK